MPAWYSFTAVSASRPPCRQADEDHQEKRIPVCGQQKGAEKRARAETDEKASAGDPELAELIPEKTLHQGENRAEAQCQDADLVAQGIENSLRVSHRRHLFFYPDAAASQRSISERAASHSTICSSSRLWVASSSAVTARRRS